MRQRNGNELFSTFNFEPLESRQLLSGGQLDPTFGDQGKLSTALGLEAATAVAVQADGKIITIASARTGVDISRFNVDGSIDKTFGSRGIVSSDFSGNAAAVAIAPDGKIVVLGTSVNLVVARYDTDGSVDTTFNSGVFQTVDFGGNDTATALAIGSGGDIYVGGNIGANGFSEIGIAHLNSNGQLDSHYGTAGEVVIGGAGSFLSLTGIALQADQKLVYAGTSSGSSTSTYVLSRLTTAGVHDPSFHDFSFVSGTGFALDAVAIDSAGRIVAAGQQGSSGPALYRLNGTSNAGTLDTTFGNDGIVLTGDSNQATFAYTDLVIQPDGKIIVARQPGAHDVTLLRYNSDGSLDTSFGTGGEVDTDFNGSETHLALALAPSNKLVVAGGSANELDIARYLIPPAPTASVYQSLRLRSSQKSYSFVISYANGGSQKDIDPKTFGNGDVIVTGPNGYSQPATKLLVQSLRRGYLVTYAVPAPSHRWASADNGIYTIHFQPAAVFGNSGAANSPGDLGQFSVKIAAVTPAFIPAISLLKDSTIERKVSDVLT